VATLFVGDWRTVDVASELVPILGNIWRTTSAPRLTPCSHQPGRSPAAADEVPPPWVAACQKAGVSGLHFHNLLGSGATWAAVAGATPPEWMHRLGHHTHTAALRYQHATAERNREVAGRLGALLRPGQCTTNPAPMWSSSARVKSRYSTPVPRPEVRDQRVRVNVGHFS
jgi:hypothetical protein